MSNKPPSLAVVALYRILYGLYTSIVALLVITVVSLWDFGLLISNAIRPALPTQGVIPQGRPGARGVWPQFVPPKDSDSRCACPGLNAMANHGLYSLDVCVA